MTYTVTCCDDGSGKTVGKIIRLGSVSILLDPSWCSEKVSYEEAVNYWSTIIIDVDIILLSQPTLEFLGAYTLLHYNFLSHFISRIEVYATLPVANLGRTSTIDYYVSRGILGPYESSKLEVEEVEKSFDHITTIKFSQMIDLRSKFDGLSFVAYSSGVNIGGSIWCIMCNAEKLLYAPLWNHAKDILINGTSAIDTNGKPLSTAMKPSTIITSFEKFGSTIPYRKRSINFKDTLEKSLQNGGSVLIPANISGKLLDLLVLTKEFLYENSIDRKYNNLNILLISYSRGRIITYVRSMLEWFSASLLKTWNRRDNNTPFDFNSQFHVIYPDQLQKYKGPKICFVSDVNVLLDEVISKLCTDEKMTVLLTSLSNMDTNIPFNDESDETDIIKSLQNHWALANVAEGTKVPCDYQTKICKISRKTLKGKDLETYSSKLEQKREDRQKLELQLRKDASKSIGGLKNTGGNFDFEVESDDDEDDYENDNLLNLLSAKDKTVVQKKETPIDMIVNARATNKHQMFQFYPNKLKQDEYGTIIDFSQFIPKEDENSIEADSLKRTLEESEGKANNNEEEEEGYDPNQLAKSLTTNSKKRQKNGTNIDEKKYDNIDYLKSNSNPQRITRKVTPFQIKCSLSYINMDNFIDKRSTVVIWPTFKPRKIVLLAPQSSQNQDIIQVLNKKNIDISMLAPNTLTEFNTTIKTLDISIDAELEKLLKWQRISDDHTVAHLTGILVRESPSIKTENGSDQDVKDSKSNRNFEHYKMVLKPLVDNHPAFLHAGSSIKIGDVRLTEIKRKLALLNHKAEFRGEGILVVDNRVAVRKLSDGETVVEGPPSKLYESVKKIVTDMLATI